MGVMVGWLHTFNHIVFVYVSMAGLCCIYLKCIAVFVVFFSFFSPFRWNDINNMTHNKSFFALELANKEDTIQFQTVSSVKPVVLLVIIPGITDAFLYSE